MKNIHLHIDKEMFYKMKQDKDALEAKIGISITWENYVIKLFKLNGGSKNDRR